MPVSGPPLTRRSRWNWGVRPSCSTRRSQRRRIPFGWQPRCAWASRRGVWRGTQGASRNRPRRNPQVRNSVWWAREFGRVSLPSPPLLLVTDRSQARLPLIDIVSEACAAGCRWISVREKDLSEDEQIAIFGSLRRAVQKWRVRATIHGSVRTVKAAGDDGVHLMAGRNPVAARAQLGSGALIGLSVHHPHEIERLPRDVLDYVIAGPVHETESKPGYGPALGAAGIAVMAASDNLPVIAIGGITPERASDVIAAGATGIAVMGAVMRSATPGREIARLLEALAGCKVEQNQ